MNNFFRLQDRVTFETGLWFRYQELQSALSFIHFRLTSLKPRDTLSDRGGVIGGIEIYSMENSKWHLPLCTGRFQILVFLQWDGFLSSKKKVWHDFLTKKILIALWQPLEDFLIFFVFAPLVDEKRTQSYKLKKKLKSIQGAVEK